MKVDEIASPDVNTVGGGEIPPSAGLTSNALPEVQSYVAKNSQTGVSTKNALSTTKKSSNNPKEPQRVEWTTGRFHALFCRNLTDFCLEKS